MVNGSFRKTVWDPLLIISQIIAMQCAYYVGLGFWICIFDFVSGRHTSLEQMFDYKELQFKDLHGRLLMSAFLLNSLTCSAALWLIVGRSKQCLDFTGTAHFLHTITCWAYGRTFPATLSWWLLTTVCVTLMTVLGEYLCMRSEMQAIPLSSSKADL